ncbi:MAG: hypothetical protein HFG53_16935 [Lachnospiraceae bacterium]|jgi:hypothetical protein|nr:hypothetical protein [Lachnospiraceae bacterium]
MKAAEKNRLSREAALQMKALGQIERWKKTALALSAVGVAFLYAGIGGQKENIFFSILGISLLFAGVGSAAVLNLGLRNGKRNVEKILNQLEADELCHIS